MNPNENNPMAPSGAGSAGSSQPSSIPSPLDFTNPSVVGSTSSLSMADSLASAQDNLTSAGQAANLPPSSAVGINQIGASTNDSTASMVAPDQPLTPADPVPGSIGSVTSVPPLNSDPLVSANRNAATTPAANTTAPAQPYFNPFAASTTPTMGANPTDTSANTTPAASNSGFTSSSNVPPALQPPVEKFSDRLKTPAKPKDSGKMTMILSWVLVAVLAGTSVLFAVLWQIAEGKAREKEIVYIPTEPVVESVAAISCSQDLGGEPVEGLEGLTYHTRSMSANFKDEQLEDIAVANAYTFVDAPAAEAAFAHFDSLGAFYDEMAVNLGVEALGRSTVLTDNVVTHTVDATPERLVGDYAGAFLLPIAEDGSVSTDLESVKAAYEGAGFVCNVEM